VKITRSAATLLLTSGLLALSPLALAQELPGWNLTWSDEFNSPTLDTTKWRAENAALVKNNEQQYYSPAYVQFAGGNMLIKSDRVAQGGRPYTSGLIETRNKFSQTFGRFEARMRLPGTQGIWPAFWMLPQSGIWPPEIDIMELLGHDPTRMYMSNHWGVYPSTWTYRTTGYTGPNFTTGYNTFAVEWYSNRLEFYVNGVRRATHNQGIPQVPFYLIFNTAVGGDWPGFPDGSTVFPQWMRVDWVRVYQPIIQNASIESMGPNANAGLYGWGNWGNAFYDGTIGRTGASSAKIFGNFNGGSNTSGIFQDINAAPGKRYRAQAWFYTPSGDKIASPNFAAVNIEWRNAQDQLISFETFSSIDSATAANTWVQGEVRGIAPAGTTKARIVGIFVQNNNAGGSVRIDDLDIREVQCPADLVADFSVDDADFVLFATAYNELICGPVCPADLNNDGFVDDSDFVLFADAYNELTCP
jgi:beta-glucanase (GH16 family)